MCHAPTDVPCRPDESAASLSGRTAGETMLFTGRRRCCIGPMTSRPANRLRQVLFEHNRLLRSGCWLGLTYRCDMFCWSAYECIGDDWDDRCGRRCCDPANPAQAIICRCGATRDSRRAAPTRDGPRGGAQQARSTKTVLPVTVVWMSAWAP